MPTESTFFFAGLLFLAAGLGYFFARFGDFDAEDQHDAERSRFLKGFRYLLNEEPDRAVEAFTEGGEVNEEALDIQLSLGTLFRRRGELERAIRIHQNVAERPGLNPAQRDRALFALAEDYLGAGLFDRAEELLNRLRDSPPYRVDALGRLLRIAEMTRDWERAVDLCGELGRAAPGAVTGVQRANYYCELAGLAQGAGQVPEARRLLELALAAEPTSVRARLLRADLDLDGDQPESAREDLSRLAMEEPSLIPEILPRLRRKVGEGALAREVARLAAGSAEARAALAMTVIRDPSLRDPASLDLLGSWLVGDPFLAALVGQTGELPPPARIEEIRSALAQVARTLPAFQCRSCGYHSASLQWQCPGCRSWETIRATTRLLPGPGG